MVLGYQAGAILFHKRVGANKVAVLLNIKKAKFRKAVHPGDVLTLHVEGIHMSSSAGRFKSRATVGDALACGAEIGFAIVNSDQV